MKHYGNVTKINGAEVIPVICVNHTEGEGVKGECYPCKPDVFAKTYEEVEE